MKPNHILQRFEEQAKPGLHLVPCQEGAVSRSRLGGLPSLPAGTPWPEWKDAPLAFLAQIELSELPEPSPIEGMPRQGRLMFFYEQEQGAWGFDPNDRGSCRVVYDPAPEPAASAEAPASLPEASTFNEKFLRFQPIATLPTLERLNIDYTDDEEVLLDEVSDRLEEIYGNRPEHQIGGFPGPVQNDEMELECQLVSNGIYCGDPSGYEDPRAKALEAGASDWQLLLQLDSDHDAGMLWGDCGRLYFWIRQQDLAAHDFSNVWMMLQCS